MEHCWLTNRQIEAARIAMTRHIKRGGRIWIRIFPDRPTTASRPRPAWAPARGLRTAGCAVIRPGRILFEMEGVDEETAKRGPAPGPDEAVRGVRVHLPHAAGRVRG